MKFLPVILISLKVAEIFVGTSGWNYKHWREIVYPKGLPQARWLSFISERFTTVEVNTSFYRIPTESMVAGWDETAPPGFRFALKLWRGITHYRKLNNTEDFVDRFLDVVNCLAPEHRAPVLAQLPPNQGKDVAKLDEFLKRWSKRVGNDWRLALEFRNSAWLEPDVYHLLNRHSTALCLHDMQGAAPVDRPNDVEFVYMRRHGSGSGRYSGQYSPEQIATDTRNVENWLKDGRDVYVYYNNDIGGHAYYNALELAGRISGNQKEYGASAKRRTL